MPLLPFVDYTVSGGTPSAPITLNNNQTLPALLISYAWSGSESIIVEYSIIRNGVTEIGTIEITTDGTSLGHDIAGTNNTNNSDSGITLLVALNGANVEISYTSTNNGFAGQFRFLRRNLSS